MKKIIAVLVAAVFAGATLNAFAQGTTPATPAAPSQMDKADKKAEKKAKKAEKKAAKKEKKAAKKGGARKANAAFMAPVTPSATLAPVVGDKPIPRTEVTKRLWAYIKKNGLQDQKNRRQINADAALKGVFGGKASVNMFEMTKLVGKHLK